jgi:hypothetical protein
MQGIRCLSYLSVLSEGGLGFLRGRGWIVWFGCFLVRFILSAAFSMVCRWLRNVGEIMGVQAELA